MRGQGFLWCAEELVAPGVTLERLRMEIPDLTFPIDVRGGIARFRQTRCLVRDLALRLDEAPILDALIAAAEELDDVDDAEIRLEEGGVAIALRVPTSTTHAWLRFVLTPVPTTWGDMLLIRAAHIEADGALGVPAELLVREFLGHLAFAPGLGEGTAFPPHLGPDGLVLRPLKLALLELFAARGWKLPGLSEIGLMVSCGPHGATIFAARATAPPIFAPVVPEDEEVDEDDDEEPAREAEDELEEFRGLLEQSVRRPPPMPDLGTLPADSALGRVLQRRHAPAPAPPHRSEPEPLHERPVPPDLMLEELEAALSRARKADDLDATAAALTALLEGAQLAHERRADLAYELAELLYYELEDSDGALPWLLELREIDPSGYGARPAVLNAIEAIYEERGSIDGQLEILKARLEQAGNDDMRDTYRLLIAQLEWEERGDPDAARKWLDAVLARDDRHEGARRLLAEIAEDAREWDKAAEHLKIALSVAGDGLDSVELEKRLALIYLDRLARPQDALRHLQNVQVAAPQDAGVMDSVRRCHAALGDWPAYVGSLRSELALLLGPGAPSGDAPDWFDAIDPAAVPAPLRIPASHVLADIARALQDELGHLPQARRLWQIVVELWPDHLEAIERRIDLDRKLADDGGEA